MQWMGRILQIQNFSVNDGNGIRSTVFLAGCPLRCAWCANPEGLTQQQKVAFFSKNCIGCGRCTAVCPEGIGIDLNIPRERIRCTACGACVAVCPTGARKEMVKEVSVEEVLQELKPYVPFFRQSGGGVTFSGGEPTLQLDFLNELSKRLYDKGIDLAIETSSYFHDRRCFSVLERFQMIFTDIKSMDGEKHRLYTGAQLDVILDNIKQYRTLPAEVIIRVPVIEGVNADRENIQKTAAFVARHLPKAKMELLPYHQYGEAKYEALGLEFGQSQFQTPSRETMLLLKEDIEKQGVQTVEFR